MLKQQLESEMADDSGGAISAIHEELEELLQQAQKEGVLGTCGAVCLQYSLSHWRVLMFTKHTGPQYGGGGGL